MKSSGLDAAKLTAIAEEDMFGALSSAASDGTTIVFAQTSGSGNPGGSFASSDLGSARLP
jgi:hypothetical protein